jgi:hypothetical protein
MSALTRLLLVFQVRESAACNCSVNPGATTQQSVVHHRIALREGISRIARNIPERSTGRKVRKKRGLEPGPTCSLVGGASVLASSLWWCGMRLVWSLVPPDI